MYLDTVDQFAASAAAKSAFLRRSPLGFAISAMMAGAYVGLGIILIFSIGSDVDPAYRSLIMGASFGIALTLVIFAGSELFTGHTMIMSLGVLRGRVGLGELAQCWAASWIGNLAGCAVLAVLLVAGGGGAMLHSKSNFIMTAATAKMTAPALSLFARAILCNWLVCLAIWMSGRMQSDAAKCIAIFWCLFGFIGSGYEHSVANMTLLLVALLFPHPDTVTWGGFVYNMVWVTLGNAVAGALFMATAYWAASRPQPIPAGAALKALGDAAD
ncbi:MAG TPA: nitrite transporter NirC [Stellaceae bacterium]|nr:nitrite transporter NirC [Stellaceae bacterium]